MRRVHTLVVGAGQAGLATSYHLTRRGIEHVVLERGRIAETWRSRRWDSFTLVGPNWTCALPGAPYVGDEPEGFMRRDELVRFLTDYATRIGAPVQRGVSVERLRPDAAGGWVAQTSAGEWRAHHVVLATGAYQRPRVPENTLAPSILALHSAEYRSADQLPVGAVLVVGSAQSGAQIAEELAEAGRIVWLASGRCGWLPRRYRGRDNVTWRKEMGLFDQTVDEIPSELRFAAIPIQTGRGGGHDLSLRTLAACGVRVLGRCLAVRDMTVILADDVEENLRASDDVAEKFRIATDAYVREKGFAAPEAPPRDEHLPDLDRRTTLDLCAEGVRAVIWATGYQHDFGWIDVPFCDERGYPLQRRGVTRHRGLYVIGLHVMWTRWSGTIFGVGADASYLVDHIANHGRAVA